MQDFLAIKSIFLKFLLIFKNIDLGFHLFVAFVPKNKNSDASIFNKPLENFDHNSQAI